MCFKEIYLYMEESKKYKSHIIIKENEEYKIKEIIKNYLPENIIKEWYNCESNKKYEYVIFK